VAPALIAFQGQDIIRLLGQQLPGNGLLAAERVERDNRVGQVQATE